MNDIKQAFNNFFGNGSDYATTICLRYNCSNCIWVLCGNMQAETQKEEINNGSMEL